jgi:L,D-transpeptidase YcbB
MSLFGRAWARPLLLSGLSAAAMVCATSVAFADPQSPASSFGVEPDADVPMLAPYASEFTRGSSRRVSSPTRAALARARVGEEQGGGSRCPTRVGDGASDSLPSRRGPPPLPAPTRGGGCANGIDSAGMQRALSLEARLAFGELGTASPLLTVFVARHGARGNALEASLFAEPELGLAPAEAAPAQEPAPQDNPAPVVYDPTAGPPLSPIESALQTALQRLVEREERRNPLGGGNWRAAREAIAAFYAARFYEPVWVGEDGLTEAGRSALSQLERARDDGLDLSAFALPRDLKPGLDPDAIAEAEATIAAAVVTYAEQATGSRVPPWRVSPFIFAARNRADPGAALAETAAAADPAQRLADFNPPQRGYRELREELARLDDAAPVAARRRLVPGRTRTASISVAFAFGSRRRERTAILANMEMWRWEPRDMGEERIEVNIPDFSVSLLEGDRVIFQSRVIVGKPQTPTPVFSSVMRYVLINPFWLVPDSIIRKEMMPRLRSLSRHGYEVKTVGGRLTVRQLPGADNALGRIAFMFPNDHAIYLHDTPARELFDEERRAFSHGCIRVEDPVSLAELVLGGESSGWTADRIEAAFGDRQRTVFLPRPLPVHIEYFTEFFDEFGELEERPDVYGLTRKVEDILARASQD